MSAPPHSLFIDGRWTEGSAAATFDVINPATEVVIASVCEGSAADAEQAVRAAARAFADGRGEWPAATPAQRSRLLHRFCDLMQRDAPELCKLSRTEIGSAQCMEAVQVFKGIEQTRHWADEAGRFPFVEPLPPVTGPLGGAGQGAIFKEPVGVVAAITPFNFPILLNLWKLAPALAMGNTVVLKPSPYTPLSALALARLAAEAGFPDGVINVVTGGAAVGRVLATHPEVAMVSFTGSEQVGREILTQASGTFKRVLLELGGKSASIVFADVDLDNPRLLPALLGFTAHCGQGCALNTRLLIERPIHDAIVERLAAALSTVRIGDPADPAVTMGPLIREAQRERVERYVSRGLEEGANLVFGGRRPTGLARGFFVEPTLFTGVTNAMRVAREEIFGPVAVVIPFDDEAQAVAIANDSPYGLGGAVWSGDTARALRVARALRTGYVSMNGGDGQLGGPIGHAPFGGYKQSGLGREHGSAGAHEYLELKTVDYPIG
jgi:aldehyde dehydrogenase (NAD+)